MVLEQFIIDADIIWDQVGKTFFENPEAKPGRIMRVQVVNAGIIEDLTGYTLNLGWTSVRDPSKFGLDAFDGVDITKGIFEIEYTSGMLTNVGPLNASLQLVPPGEGRPIESNNFKLTVKNSAINPEAIQGETSFKALENALVEVNGWNARIDVVEQDFKDRADALDGAYPVRLTAAEQSVAAVEAQVDLLNRGLGETMPTMASLLAAYPTGDTRDHIVAGNIAEVDTLTVTGVPTTAGNVTVTLNGVAVNVPVTVGVAEVASLQVAAVPTVAGNVTVNLNGTPVTVALDPAVQTTTDLVAAAIRAATFTGWTTGGAGSTVTFTATAVGTKTDATYSAGATSATGTMTTTTQGVAVATTTTVATAIRAATFAGWTTGGTGAVVTFTATTVGTRTAPGFSGGTTGTTGTFVRTAIGEAANFHRYFWNGTAWTDGGIYQAVDVLNSSVDLRKLKGKSLVYGVNLYEYATHYKLGWIDPSGVIKASSTYGRAQIPVPENTVISLCRMVHPAYNAASGATLFLDAKGDIITIFDGEPYINGKYEGVDYITVLTPQNCAFVSINANLAGWDSKEKIICVLGNTLTSSTFESIEIEGIFSGLLRDKKIRSDFNNFLKSIKSEGGNKYIYPDHFTADKYVDMTGLIKNATGWGLAKVPADPNETYSIFLPSGMYSSGIGSIAFYDSDMNILSYVVGSDYINGTYAGVNFITVNTPAYTDVIAITCVRVNATDGFDNSQSLIVCKGDVVSEDALIEKLSEVNGIPVIQGAQTPSLPYTDIILVVIGDSLTERNLRSTKYYHDHAAENLGFAVTNMGRSGTGYKRTEEQSLAFYQRVLGIRTDAQVVTVFGSFNDLGGGYTLGTPADTGTTTICGCMNTFFDNYYSVLPTVPIGVITPTPWVGNYPGIAGADNYVNALIEICKKRSIPYLDLYHGSNLRPWDAEFRTLAYSKDDGNGVHPDETGHKIIAAPYREFVKSLI